MLSYLIIAYQVVYNISIILCTSRLRFTCLYLWQIISSYHSMRLYFCIKRLNISLLNGFFEWSVCQSQDAVNKTNGIITWLTSWYCCQYAFSQNKGLYLPVASDNSDHMPFRGMRMSKIAFMIFSNFNQSASSATDCVMISQSKLGWIEYKHNWPFPINKRITPM